MRIVIDMQGAQTGSRLRGIGRYTMALARAMVRHRGEHEVILLLNGMFPETLLPIRKAFGDLLPQTQIYVWNALGPVCTDNPENTPLRMIAAEIREDFIARLKPDVLHITSFFEGFGDSAVHSILPNSSRLTNVRIAVTFYDVIPLIQKDIYLDPNPHFQKPYYEKIQQLKNADLLLAISESSRSEAIEYLDFDATRVINISTAVDDKFKPVRCTEDEAKSFKLRLGIQDRFIMYSGATDDRKNHIGLISAYALLPENMRALFQLVLVGGLPITHKQHFEKHIKKCGLNNERVVITGRVSDEDMIHAYSVCDLYVFPSWHEGFGLPALEAMSCGAAVIGACTTSVPEVIGFERALFDPHSPQAIAEKILEALTDLAFYRELKAHARTQAAKFSWDESAKRAIQGLETLSNNNTQAQSIDIQDTSASLGRLVDRLAPMIAATKELDLVKLSEMMASNSLENKRQLLVDVSELIQRDSRSGIQRVVRSIVNEWMFQQSKALSIRLVYADNRHLGYRYADRFAEALGGIDRGNTEAVLAQEDPIIDFENGDIFVALDLQHEVQIFQRSFYEKMRARGVNVTFVVYDLLPVTMPHCFPAEASSNHAQWLASAASADKVVCISRAVAKDFGDWLDQSRVATLDRPNVDWFHLGADIENSMPTVGLPADAKFILHQIAQRPSFLMVGTLEPRKGHAQVVEAFDLLWSTVDCNLVVVGRSGWGVENLLDVLRTHREFNRRLFWLEGVTDEYLEKIYASCSCLIAASYGEGFGLPLIEAAQHQLPILARNISVFHEVAGDHAYYFESLSSEVLALDIERWLALYVNEQHPRSDDMRWLTWLQSSQQLMQCVLTVNSQSIDSHRVAQTPTSTGKN